MVRYRKEKWRKSWNVPKSTGDGHWVVSISWKNEWACSCPVWIYRRQVCHHIRQIQMLNQNEMPRPEYVLAACHKVIYKPEEDKLYVPLVRIGDTGMEATICYNLLKYGYSWGEVKEIRHNIPKDWTASKVMEYVEIFGEKVYPIKEE